MFCISLLSVHCLLLCIPLAPLLSLYKPSPTFCSYVCEDSTNNLTISLTAVQHTCYTIKNWVPYNVTHVGDYNKIMLYIIMMTNVLAPSITWLLQNEVWPGCTSKMEWNGGNGRSGK